MTKKLFILFFLFFNIVLLASNDIRLLHPKVKKATLGRPVKVTANVINAYKVNYIILHYRSSNDKTWSQVPMEPKDGKYVAEIPGDEVSSEGLLYYIELIDIAGKTTMAFANAYSPQFVSVIKPKLKATYTDNNNIKIEKEDSIEDDFAIFIDNIEDEVVTASKYSQSRSEAPANISVITREEIKDFGYHSILEILRDQGFDVNDNGSWPDIGLRGINDRTTYGKYLLIFLDGHNMSFSQFYRNIVSNGLIPIEDIERIEIQKGPGSSIWGANALSGVINIITKNYESSSLIEVGGGNLNTGSTHIRASKVFNDKFSVFASFMSYMQDTSDDMIVKEWSEVAGKDIKLENMSQDSYTFFGKVLLYDFKLTSYYNKYDPYAPITTFSVGGSKTRLVTQRFYNTLSYEKDIISTNDTDISINLSLSMDNYKFDEGAQYHDNPYCPLGTVCKDIKGKDVFQFVRDMKARDIRYDAKLYSVLNFKNLKSTLITGLDFEYLDSIRWYYPQVFKKAGIKEPHFTQINTALFSQIEIKPIDWIGIVGGIRYDKNSIYDAKISPKASLVLTPGDLFFKAIWGQGYKAPSLHELYYFRKDAYYGNPTLKPEDSNSLELQLGYNKKDFLDIELTFFRTGINNVISYDKKTNTSNSNSKFDSPNDFPGTQLPSDGDEYSQQANKKEYRTTGFEFYTKVKPVKSLYVIIRAGFNSAISVKDDKRLNYGQEKFMSLGINYKYLNRYNFNLSGRYVGDKLVPLERFGEYGNPYNPPKEDYDAKDDDGNPITKNGYSDSTLSTDPYFIVNLAFNVDDIFAKGINASFRVENLFNTTIYDAGREILYPLTGIRFWGYVKYTF